MKQNLWISADFMIDELYVNVANTGSVLKVWNLGLSWRRPVQRLPVFCCRFDSLSFKWRTGILRICLYSFSFTTCRIIEQIQVESLVWLDSILWWVKETTRSLLGLLCWESFIIIIVFVLRRGTNLWEGKIHCGRRYRGGDVHCLYWISEVERMFIVFRFSWDPVVLVKFEILFECMSLFDAQDVYNFLLIAFFMKSSMAVESRDG